MFTIRKRFHFSAAHRLQHMPSNHPCANLHGHNYQVEVELQSAQLNNSGFVVDYLDLALLKNYISKKLDHQYLNEVLGDDCVTAEQLAYHLYTFCKKHWQQTVAVRVYETEKTCAEYRP